MNLEPKKSNFLPIIIVIIAIAAIAVGGVFIINKFKGNDSKSEEKTSKESKKESKSEKTKVDVKYLNPLKGNPNKIAFNILTYDDNEWILTLDTDKELIFRDTYFGEYIFDDNATFEASRSTMVDNTEIELGDDIEITIDTDCFDEDDGKIIEEQNGWLLTKSNYGDDEIYYKGTIDGEEDWIVVEICSYEDVEDESALVHKYYDFFVQNANFYLVKEENDKYIFTDFSGNKKSLAEYNFVNDMVIKALTKNDIYLRDSLAIKGYDSNNFDDLDYYLEKSYYSINRGDSGTYEQREAMKGKTHQFSYNNHDYTLLYKENENSAYLETNLNEKGDCIDIFVRFDDLKITDNLDEVINRIKKEIL